MKTFEKTPAEKNTLKLAKRVHKYKVSINADESLIGAFLKNSMPKWGAFIFNGNRL